MSTVQTNRIQHSSGTGNNIILSADGDTQVNSLNSGQLAGFRSVLINGSYEIWQRGTTLTYQDAIDVVFSADRWANYRANSGGTCTTTRINISDLPGFSAGLQMTGSGVGYTQACYQPVELNPNGIVPFGVGQTWTLSCYVKGSSAGTSELFAQFNTNSSLVTGLQAIASENIEFTTSWQRFSLTFVIPSPTGTPGAMNVGLYDADGTTSTNVQVTGMQLEPGPVATPFEQRPIGTELALCQRYYQTLGDAYLSPIKSDNTLGFVSARTVSMRVKPTETGGISKVTGGNINGTAYKWNVSASSYNGGNTASISNLIADAEL